MARQHSTSLLSPTLGTQTSKTRSMCHKLDATIILMFHETVIKCGDVVIILVQNVVVVGIAMKIWGIR